jgi:hypothetical protein
VYVSEWTTGAGLPVRSILDENYPNPSDSTTVIRFHALWTAVVTGKVNDILWREIGTYDARGLASGAYFYPWQLGSRASMMKAVLNK